MTHTGMTQAQIFELGGSMVVFWFIQKIFYSTVLEPRFPFLTKMWKIPFTDFVFPFTFTLYFQVMGFAVFTFLYMCGYMYIFDPAAFK